MARSREATKRERNFSTRSSTMIAKKSGMPLLAGEKKGATKARRNVAQRGTTDGTLQPGNVEGNEREPRERKKARGLWRAPGEKRKRERKSACRRGVGDGRLEEYRGPHRAHDAWTAGGDNSGPIE